MKAVVRTGVRGVTLTFVENHPDPRDAKLQPTDVLVKVKAAPLNPIDYKFCRLFLGKGVGGDAAGIVEKVGSEVTDVAVGDKVFGWPNSGAFAEYSTMSATEAAVKPDHLSFEEAAALVSVYLAGLQALRTHGKVTSGSSVLVIGASGGCGVAGVQLAKGILGASRVVGICSGKNFDFVEEVCRGSENAEVLELVDYTDKEAVRKFQEENVGAFDCIYDTCTGSGKDGDYASTFPALLKEETGQYIQLNGSPLDWMRAVAGKSPRQKTMLMLERNRKGDLEEVASLLESSGMKVHLSVRPFDEQNVAEGIEELKTRRVKGKIVFKMG